LGTQAGNTTNEGKIPMKFTKGQVVVGKVTGKFVVVKCEFSTAHGSEVVTVNEVSPDGNVSKSKMKFPADVLVAI
jgi:hypothetical protein